MAWSTDSRAIPFHPLPPDAVRFTFVASPDDHVIVAGVPGLVDHLRRSGKTAVPVRFEVVCAAWGGHMRWFTMLSADGQSVVPSSALGGAERTGNSRAPDPLAAGCP
jgi:hypothetical protein